MINKSIKIKFKVDYKITKFFSDYRNFNNDINSLLFEGKKELKKIERKWKKIEKNVINLLNQIFKHPVNSSDITIYIFPEYFYIGSSETSKKVILYGQPSKTNFFAQAIITHEICHIFLSCIYTKRPVIVDEIICCLFEDYIYSTYDSKDFCEIWYKCKLDNFHLAAYDFITNNRDLSLKGLSSNFKNITQLINIVISRLNPEIIKLKPQKGLINQLNSEFFTEI